MWIAIVVIIMFLLAWLIYIGWGPFAAFCKIQSLVPEPKRTITTTRQITVREGILEGEQKDGYAVFRGIPYAKPPVGKLRWRAPEPMDAWEGVRQVTEFGNRCWQPGSGGFYKKEFYSESEWLPPMSEDCLYLNVWVPDEVPEGGAPVAFWIHGGAFQNGFGSEMEFDGEAYAKQGVILVSINYRLGIFGFLSLPELAAEDPHGSTGNYGILDQIAALSWVRKNISVFGGDPERITIMGQSAGARSVQTLVTSPLSRDLVAGAVLQSGGGASNFMPQPTVEKAYTVGRKLMKLCFARNAADLRNIPAQGLMHCFWFLASGCNGVPFCPVLDGYVLTEDYCTALQNGHISDIPYVLGSNSQDMGGGSTENALYQGNLAWADIREKTSCKPTYVYYFSRKLPGDDSGAFHSAELWYMFGTLNRCWRPMEALDYKLSEEMVSCWVAFVKNGNPGASWRRCTEQDPFVKQFR